MHCVLGGVKILALSSPLGFPASAVERGARFGEASQLRAIQGCTVSRYDGVVTTPA
jgi:hypothetical protein